MQRVGSRSRRTPVALLNLLSQPARTLACVLGVSFALLLIFMQLGFRGAVANTANIVYGKLEGDLVLRSPDYVHLYEPRMFDRGWMRMVSGHPMVDRVDPFFIMLMRWQNPPRPAECTQAPPDGSFRTVGMMGMEIEHPVLNVPEIREQIGKLKNPDAVLVDRATRAEYGPGDCKRFSDRDIGSPLELGNRLSHIAGHFQLGTGLATNGAVLLSDVGYSLRSGVDTRQRVSLGLVRLRPGVDAQEAKNSLIAWLSQRDPRCLQEIQILTMKEQLAWERSRWLRETPIGMIFTMGVILSFIIGAAIVYMILANDVSNRLPEYATLKAMGYSHLALARIVLMQSWLLALISYLPAALVSYLLYELTAGLSKIPTTMTWERLSGVLAMSLVMCSVSGFMAMLRLWKAEPASLF
ncbi:MAG: FtsX-like permease family protein [Pirellula sp.]